MSSAAPPPLRKAPSGGGSSSKPRVNGRTCCSAVSARSGTGIVGFLCGRRDEVSTLGPMYLLDEVQGQGVGSRMMTAFLAWAGGAPMRLWVTEYNERAVRFYERYGFRTTGERELWRGKLPNVRMTRAAESKSSDRLSGITRDQLT
ncbi:GNAT family N-acetyltransferase [Streptomyces sp. Edi2]|uniref:GNAT family N-acetyltransferase n=1 Tax=Streptomyces sp. Edi2 TaxID=3162528 RepID=UPI003305CE72